MTQIAKTSDKNTAAYQPSDDELTRRGLIVELEDAMNDMEGSLGEDPFPLMHHFADGCYAREIVLPKGSTVVGKIHKHEHFIIFLSGDVTISSEKGNERINKPGIAISPLGIKRAVYANEESRIITIHVTEKTDLKDIEAEVIAKDFNSLTSEKSERLEVEK